MEDPDSRTGLQLGLGSSLWGVTRPLRATLATLFRSRSGPRLPTIPAPASDKPPLAPSPFPNLSRLRCLRPRAQAAIVLHVTQTNAAEQILDQLRATPEPFDLFVTTDVEVPQSVQDLLHDMPAVRGFWAFPVGSGAMLPFLAIAATGALFGYERVAKLHTRRGGEGSAQLVGSGGTLRIALAFERDADLGLVLPDGACHSRQEYEALAGTLHDRVVRQLFHAEPPPHYASGSTFWIRSWLLRDVVALELQDVAQQGELDFIFGLVCSAASMKVEPLSVALVRRACAPDPAPRVIAFYLPQFHPIPENDRWWGPGFTEWTNVTRARPLFEGHRQPRLPAELGFTDLRVPETRQAQADLARAYGVSGFCYYYYWFGKGRKLLHRPLDEVLSSGRPDFPFMICWANESWSRRWDGAENDILVEQRYEPGWELDFAEAIAPLLADRRYVRDAAHRPMVLIYRLMQVPSPQTALERLRHALAQLGFDAVHLSAGRFALPNEPPMPDDPASVGCDSFFEFPPHGFPIVPAAPDSKPRTMTGHILEYVAMVDRTVEQLAAEPPQHRVHHGVMMGWDNTARRGAAAHVFRGATPAHFRRWLRAAIQHTQRDPDGSERFVFVNAWNEWAEGTCLEPDSDFGRGWLEAVRSALGPGLIIKG